MFKKWLNFLLKDKLRFYEMIGSALWFFMDGFWMMKFNQSAISFAVPTIAVNVFVFKHTEKSVVQYLVTTAMNCWLLMNVSWMFSDLKQVHFLVQIAFIFFLAGILALVLALMASLDDEEELLKIVKRFKRLRIR